MNFKAGDRVRTKSGLEWIVTGYKFRDIEDGRRFIYEVHTPERRGRINTFRAREMELVERAS